VTERTPPPLAVDPETGRAHQLDVLAAILMDRRDGLSHLLIDDDVETLKHLARRGIVENTLRAPASDLAYLEAWAVRGDRRSLHWPSAEATLLKFVAHHLRNTAKREAQRKHGMPQNVAGSLREGRLLRSENPHAPATVTRRLSSWPPCTAGGGSRGHSPPLPCGRRCGWRFGRRFVPVMGRGGAVTRDVHRLLATCASDRLADTRDVAILIVAFPSGGRRCSEAAGLRIEQLREEPSVQKHEPSAAESRRDVGALEQFPSASTGGPTRNALPSSSAAAVLVRPSWIARSAPGPRPRPTGRSPGTPALRRAASVDQPHR
jgi:hypothetical protein